MSIRFAAPLFVHELVMFSAALAAGIFTARRFQDLGVVSVRPDFSFSFRDVAFLIIFLVVFIAVVLRYRQIAHRYFQIFLPLVTLWGAQIIASAWLAFPFDWFAGAAVATLYLATRRILVHNFAVLCGIVGIGIAFGMNVTPRFAVVLLVGMSIYDIIAVYKTRHMVTLAREMVSSGAVFGFLIPQELGGWLESQRNARVGESHMVLGSGDVALPLILIASLVVQSLGLALGAAIGAVVGLLGMHLLFVNQRARMPMAALPPIATMATLGYLVALFVVK